MWCKGFGYRDSDKEREEEMRRGRGGEVEEGRKKGGERGRNKERGHLYNSGSKPDLKPHFRCMGRTRDGSRTIGLGATDKDLSVLVPVSWSQMYPNNQPTIRKKKKKKNGD